MASRCGYSADVSGAINDRAMFHADNAYYLPAATITTKRMKTNTVSNTAFRGFGGPQGMMVAERAIDEIAWALKLDPLDFGMAGGKVTSIVQLDGKQQPMRGTLKADVKGLQMGKLFPASKDMQHDLAGTLRFDVNSHWLVKLEAHYMHGTAGLDPTLNGGMPLDKLTRDWALFLAKTTAYF